VLLKDVKLPSGSVIVFDRGYVDYAQYERFTQEEVYYVTRLKDNAVYESGVETKFPAKIFPRRQSERYRNSNLGFHDSQFADFIDKKQSQAPMGIFQSGVCYPATIDELY
jgi:hypothetical protein